jgi:DNA-binding transcriptional ArsR family regulator
MLRRHLATLEAGGLLHFPVEGRSRLYSNYTLLSGDSAVGEDVKEDAVPWQLYHSDTKLSALITVCSVLLCIYPDHVIQCSTSD